VIYFLLTRFNAPQKLLSVSKSLSTVLKQLPYFCPLVLIVKPTHKTEIKILWDVVKSEPYFAVKNAARIPLCTYIERSTVLCVFVTSV